ncbi:hypothetical protein [Alicyclobacillus macrosporangiidus]|uniref:Uncharacterized protein n=1 Tax=Alicyclobacillus macrosporangiidus TaxID=392015 RepID=A0A1I7IF52_9BACL|nr:hypothetical protein [Alicyclobacillus macrosporangiidus]SFU71506.1 hypothetical protein SAMN05421543_106182 [Alicyclobacillus macrosporangiidus]
MGTKRENARLEQSLAALRSYAASLGRWPSQAEWDAYAAQGRLLRQMSLYYHTRKPWSKLRDEMGFAPRDKGPTEEECIRALREAAETSPLLTKRDYDAWQRQHPDRPPRTKITRQLGGTWNRAKERAGLPVIDPSSPGWSDDDLRAALAACAQDYGLQFSENDYLEWREQHPTYPHIETIRMRFGGVGEAKQALGLVRYEPGPQTEYTDGEIVSYLLRFVRQQLGLESYLQWREVNGGPSLTPIRERFGGYEPALRRALELYVQIKAQQGV